MGMRIAERDRRIILLAATTVENDAGEEEATGWAEFARAWASYLPVSDGERLRAAAIEQKMDARFRVVWSRPLVGLCGEHRLHFEGADWQITGVKETGHREGLEITAWRLKRGGM